MKEIEFFKDLEIKERNINIGGIFINNDENFAIVKISGIIDTYNSDIFRKAIEDYIDYNKKSKILIIDMEKISYTSSTGIGALVQIQKKCTKRGIKLYLMSVDNKIKEVLSLLGFIKFFSFIDEWSDISEEKIERSIFPTTVSCPNCDKKFKVSKAGSYRCPSCKETFRVESNGKIFKRKT